MANYVRFDWAITKILRQKENFAVLDGFLNVIINDSINLLKKQFNI